MSDNVHYLPQAPKVDGLRQSMRGPYDGGGGDGMNTDLVHRVARLEDDMKEVRSDLKVVRSDLAELKGKVSMLPGWGGLLAVTGFIVAAVGLMLRFMPPAPPG